MIESYYTHSQSLTANLFAFHFGPPQPEDHGSQAPSEKERSIEIFPGVTEIQTPPGYKNLRAKNPEEDLWLHWASNKHVIVDTPENRAKLQAILQVLSLELDILEDNLKNVGKVTLDGPFVPKKLIIRSGRVHKIEADFEPFDRSRSLFAFQEYTRDYHRIADTLEKFGVYLMNRRSLEKSPQTFNLEAVDEYDKLVQDLTNIFTPGYKASYESNFIQGSLLYTGNWGDLGLLGEGYFRMESAQGTVFTRKGVLGERGYCTLNGLSPIPADFPMETLVIDQSGNAIATKDGINVNLGTISIFTPIGKMTQVAPGYFQGGFIPLSTRPRILQHMLEMSTVEYWNLRIRLTNCLLVLTPLYPRQLLEQKENTLNLILERLQALGSNDPGKLNNPEEIRKHQELCKLLEL